MRRNRDLLDEISGLNHLHFSARARKRARRKRRRGQVAVAAWIILGLAAVAGVRAPNPATSAVGALESALADTGSTVEGSSNAASATRFTRRVLQDDVTAAPASEGLPRDDDLLDLKTPLLKTPVAPTPIASPTLRGAPPAGSTIEQIIRNAAAEFGLSGDYLVSVARCESGLNPRAYHAAGYHGLFQFDFTTWGEFGYGDIYDPVAQARTTARLLAAGHHSRWPNCA